MKNLTPGGGIHETNQGPGFKHSCVIDIGTKEDISGRWVVMVVYVSN